MTHNEFFKLLKDPESVQAGHAGDLKDLVENYPYFAPGRLFYAKALQRSNSVLFSANLKFSSIYCSNRSWLYYYVHPDKKVSAESYRKDRAEKSSGDYFDMMSSLESEGGDTSNSLRNLADRLKSARALVTIPAKSKRIQLESSSDLIQEKETPIRVLESSGMSGSFDANELGAPSEDMARKMIKEHKYAEALQILKRLNLNNPKKSVYFADQIRFLEKVIANTKK